MAKYPRCYNELMEKITGIAIVFTSTVLYSSLYPLLKKANQQLPPFTTMALAMLSLFILATLASIFLENGLHTKMSLIKSNFSLIIIIGIVNFIAFWLAILGFKYMSIWQQNMFYVIDPVAAAIFAYFILGEKITINLFLGLFIMAIGLFVAVR